MISNRDDSLGGRSGEGRRSAHNQLQTAISRTVPQKQINKTVETER